MNFVELIKILDTVNDSDKFNFVTLAMKLLPVLNHDISSDIIKIQQFINDKNFTKAAIVVLEAMRLKR